MLDRIEFGDPEGPGDQCSGSRTAARADRVGVVADGGLVELGTHADLVAAGTQLQRALRQPDLAGHPAITRSLTSALAVAAELAIGVEYTQLHSLTDERLRRKIIELGTLQRVSRTVASALDLNDVLRFVSESAVELTNAESAAVFRLPSHDKEEESAPWVEYRVGTSRQVSNEASRDALLSDVIISGSARAVDMDYVDGTSILYCMPLSSARERWGALCVRLKSGMEVTEDDLTLLQAFTDTASIAIENAELFEEARRSAETASTLLQEMHHRVRNNLQTVAALLSLQLRQVEGSEAERHLQDAIGRVQAIASVHDLLSDETRLSCATIDAIARLVADELKVTLVVLWRLAKMRANLAPWVTDVELRADPVLRVALDGGDFERRLQTALSAAVGRGVLLVAEWQAADFVDTRHQAAPVRASRASRAARISAKSLPA